MLGWHLSEMRRKELVTLETPKADYSEYLQAMAAQANKTNPFHNKTNPFASRNNPFSR